MTVGPLVIPRRVHERVLEPVEQDADRIHVLVRAGAARAGLDVAEVGDQGHLGIAVDQISERGKLGEFLGTVGRVADDGEGVRFLGARVDGIPN